MQAAVPGAVPAFLPAVLCAVPAFLPASKWVPRSHFCLRGSNPVGRFSASETVIYSIEQFRSNLQTARGKSRPCQAVDILRADYMRENMSHVHSIHSNRQELARNEVGPGSYPQV